MRSKRKTKTRHVPNAKLKIKQANFVNGKNEMNEHKYLMEIKCDKIAKNPSHIGIGSSYISAIT